MGRRTMAAARVVAVLAALAGVTGECPNACSGRGTCGMHDECACYSGFMANDCSERICPFGWAHVDGGKGDLNGDGTIDVTTNPLPTVVASSQMYPKGTQEAVYLAGNSMGGHWYMECSNKGLCDRSTGMCDCFDAYEGQACQRASCPVVAGKTCSGHGVCMTVRELAYADHNNKYDLWDADKGMACKCDPGYSGFDCSERECPRGVDPLYKDEAEIDARYPTWTFRLYGATLDFATNTAVTGSFKIKYYDEFGEDWVTDAIAIGSDAVVATAAQTTTDNVLNALLALKNGVVPALSCSHNSYSPTTTAAVTCQFTANFGNHRTPEIITTDEKGISTVKLNSVPMAVTASVYDSGVLGEDVDYFALCDGVTVTQTDTTSFQTMTLSVTSVAGDYTLTLGTLGATGTLNYDDDDATVAAAILAVGGTVTVTTTADTATARGVRSFQFTTPVSVGTISGAVGTAFEAFTAAPVVVGGLGTSTIAFQIASAAQSFSLDIDNGGLADTMGPFSYVSSTTSACATLAGAMQTALRGTWTNLVADIATPANIVVAVTPVADINAVDVLITFGATNTITAAVYSTNNLALPGTPLDVTHTSITESYNMGTLTATSDTVLKRCLGDADGNTANDVEAERWDYGDNMPDDFQYNAVGRVVANVHPHLVKLTNKAALDAGLDAPATNAIVWQPYGGTAGWRVMSLVGATGSAAAVTSATNFYISTTNGYLTRVFDDVATGAGAAAPTYVTANAKPALATFTQYSASMVTLDAASYSCDQDTIEDHTAPNTLNAGTATSDDIACLSKGDTIVIPYSMAATEYPDAPAYNTAEVRTIVRIDGANLYLDRPLHYTQGPSTGLPVYKFTRGTNGSGEYAATTLCSGRGACNRADGLCQCYAGYTGAACDSQSALIL